MDYSIPAEVLERNKKVFPYAVHDRMVWVKQRRSRENPCFRHMQKMLYAVTRLLLVLPPDSSPANNVEFEVSRLRRAGELGMRVPAVLHETDDYFVIEDVGMHLDYFLQCNPEQVLETVDKAVSELRRMHDLGIAHGGAQAKNLTVKDGEIYFIDFEEDIPSDNLELFKLRDLFLFIFSLERAGTEPDLRRICAVYGKGEPEPTLGRLVKAIRQLRLLKIFNSRFFAGWSIRDIRGICNLVDKANKEYKRKQ